MKKVLWLLFILIVRITLTFIWACLRLGELLLGVLAKWLQSIIHNHIKL